MTTSRRDFLRQTGCLVMSAAALASAQTRFGLLSALAQQPAATDYKALVCIFLSGGNDGNNTVIPYDDAGADFSYTLYSNMRSSSGLAIAKANLDPITPPSIGRNFALHPSLAELTALFKQGKLAVITNVGPLVQPLTRAQYQSSPTLRPYQLFSHSDQVAQQQTSISNTPAQTGWGGRTADTLNGINDAAPLPMIVSTAGVSLYTTGKTTRPLAIQGAPTALNNALRLEGFDTSQVATLRRASFDAIRNADNDHALVKSSNDVLAQALQTSQALSTDPVPTTAFPNTSLGNQLKQVAKLISLRTTLGMSRQIFFCSLGGFDTHNTQVTNQANLLAQVSQAMSAFYNEMVALGIASQVTAFTLSDFGRTFQPAGSGAAQVGSDHAWGNHMFVLGGAVRGGDFYGTPGANGTVFPTLQANGPDDTDTRGRWIPTTSVDTYGSKLAAWFGLTAANIPTVFPNLGRFSAGNMDFI